MSGGIRQEFDQFDEVMTTALERVRHFAHPDLPNGIGLVELCFMKSKVFIGIEEEYDTLLCSKLSPESHAPYNCSRPNSFWESVIGWVLVGAWLMTNDRGYVDAVQLRFRELANEGAYTVVQLYGEASQITLAQFRESRRSSMFTG